MSMLDVPGSSLYYEIQGRGPVVILVPGASGDARGFGAVAERLAARLTVVTYDRRGFSRSRLSGPQDYDDRLRTDAEDVRRLIEHVGQAPATVFGTSSGGVVALQALIQNPEVIGTLIPYEPALFKRLPDAEEWLDFLYGIYGRYRRSGIEPALRAFRERLFCASDQPIMTRATDRDRNDLAHANAAYWFERELRQYTAADLDLTALTRYADRIVPMAGEQSRGRPTYRVAHELGRELGREVRELPGGHTGYLSHQAAFAEALLRLTA